MAFPLKIKAPNELRHPNYVVNQENWRKWRLAYEGGDRFIRQYLKRVSRRESDIEYGERLAVTYCPAFAKAGITEVKNSIFSRMGDITRTGGSEDYQNAMAGINNGVDLVGNSMNSFIARRVLPELLVMGRVGIYVDMPVVENTSKAAVKGKRPYLYWYRTEDVLSWQTDNIDKPNEFTSLLLGDTTIEDDTDAYLPCAEVRRFRHYWIDPEDGFVWVQYYDIETMEGPTFGNYVGKLDPVRLNIRRIPFVMLELSESLMMDVANYQIGLLNLASSDISYALKSNFPFYVEQFDARSETPHIKQQQPNQYFDQTTGYNPATNNVTVVNQENSNNIKIGVSTGRKYPIGTERPGFIHPSSEPLQASMQKQAQMKAEIRELINLAIQNLAPSSSGDNGVPELKYDDNTLESGLAYIGLELEIAERKIADFWSMYEGPKANTANVFYPKSYSLMTQKDRQVKVDGLLEALPKLPSKTYQKEMAKLAIRTMMENKVPQATLMKMMEEIDAAEVISVDPQVVQTDFEAGFVGLETASLARGYPKGEVEKAQKDHADRVARIAIAQSEGGGAGAPAKNPSARGTGDLSSNPAGAKQEKTTSQSTTQDGETKSKVRGDA